MLLLLLTACVVTLSGCGAGGYPGGGALTVSGNPPAGTVGAAYSYSLQATGGTAPYSWSLSSGSLPVGLSLSTSGLISGTPTTAGTASFTAQVQDALGNKASGPFNITINAGSGGGSLTLTAPPPGTVGTPYSGTVGVSGGTGPYTCVITNLPAGLSAGGSNGCTITGIPTTPGTTNINVTATDSTTPTPITTTGTVPLVINPSSGGGSLTLIAPPSGTVGTPYTGTVGVTGGTGPYTCVITNLPAGLSTAPNSCTITGTPAGPAGTTNINVTATDSTTPTHITTTGTVPLVINTGSGGGGLTLGALPAGTVGTPYSSTEVPVGGVGPYTCAITNLPAGLTATGCNITGTPAGPAGTTNVNITATDSTSPTHLTTAGTVPLVINAGSGGGGTLTFTVVPPTGTISVPYTGIVNVAGGVGPYTCTITNLPAGLTATGCNITGTPAGPAGTTNINVTATDSSTPTPITTTGTAPLTINTGSGGGGLALGTLPNGTVGVAYSSTLPVTNGTSPYSCVIGGLPAGLTAAPGSCTVTGVPTVAGTSTLSVTALDSGSPQLSTTGTVQLVIAPAPITLVLSNPADATVGVAYSSSVGVGGGTGPYTCTINGLPGGLSPVPGSCNIMGTPTTAGSSTLTVTATDTTTSATKTGPVTLLVNPAPGSLTLGTLPPATVSVAYSQTLGVTGGTGPYSCVITGLPAGLNASSCLITGTPTVAGTSTLQVTATDSSSPALTKNGPVTLVVNAAPVVLTLTGPAANGTVGTPYSSSVGVSGGTGPYSCTITNLPAGLSSATNSCSITGTPTTSGTTTINVTANDSSSPQATKSGTFPITINTAVTLSLTAPAAGTVGTPYTGAVGVGGGTGPYSCVITGLPAGLTSNSCSISGTPTVAGTSPLNVAATDSSTPTPVTTNGVVQLVINPPATLSLTGTLPNAILGQPYTQQLQATGGIAPYDYTVTQGSLPAGLTLASDGNITGTPTAVGASSFTVTVTDTETAQQTATNDYTLLVTYPSGPNNGELNGPYAFLFQGYDDLLVGLVNYKTASVGSFTADGHGLVTAGELDTNHQVGGASTHAFLGSYEIGADNRGLMAITALNTDGTAGLTTIFAITVKAPVSPATVATSAQMIEFDGDILVSSRGSGQMLQQTAVSFATGLTGPYAFGLSGDTPCLISCGVGLAGPAASVGAFTATGGVLSNGQSDAIIAAQNYSAEPLTGSYNTADANGRLTLSMTTAGTTTGFYPTNYVAYMVNANQSFILSTDSHNSYVLLAGTMKSQSTNNFTAASLNGPFIGYENTQPNPGLLGATEQSLLNLSTATVFRTSASGGVCATSNVDVGGVGTLVNDLTSTVHGVLTTLTGLQLNAILGAPASTGTSTCSVASANGRGILNYPPPASILASVLNLLGLDNPPLPRVFYLTSPNTGYFIETGYAGLGNFEAQTGSPYTLANLNGTYVYESTPPATVAGINNIGYLSADGNGNINTVLDTNVSVGSLNVLTLGTAGSGNYVYQPNLQPLDFTNPATIGRYVYNVTNVIYEISPGRFVMVDTSALTTSPTITILN